MDKGYGAQCVREHSSIHSHVNFTVLPPSSLDRLRGPHAHSERRRPGDQDHVDPESEVFRSTQRGPLLQQLLLHVTQL